VRKNTALKIVLIDNALRMGVKEMNSRTVFIMSHRLKLSWKFIKHAVGVLLMVHEREGSHYLANSQDSHPKPDNVFESYIESTKT
jgi:hypothetical protein